MINWSNWVNLGRNYTFTEVYHKYADYQDMIITGEYFDEGKFGKSVEEFLRVLSFVSLYFSTIMNYTNLIGTMKAPWKGLSNYAIILVKKDGNECLS